MPGQDGTSLWNAPGTAAPPVLAADYADRVSCKRGLTRIVLTGGAEDNFASGGTEPARTRPARLPNAYLEAVTEAKSGVMQLRDYDEGGQDKILIDHFAVPRGIVSGALVVRIRAAGGSDNDAIKLGNLDEHSVAADYARAESFAFPIKQEVLIAAAAQAGTVVMVPLERLKANPRARFKGTFLDFLNRADRPDAIDFEVEDDTVVDVAHLVLCQQPQVERGTSFTEYRSKFIGPDVSFLSCFTDKTQAPCNPFEGDQRCTAALPMACYKAGNRVPAGLDKSGLGEGYRTGGEIRATKPVIAASLATRADADRYCQAQFGAGWRILEYHDGAGGAIITNSTIAPKTRLWVDVSDQRYANCWDRSKDR